MGVASSDKGTDTLELCIQNYDILYIYELSYTVIQIMSVIFLKQLAFAIVSQFLCVVEKGGLFSNADIKKHLRILLKIV
jgi:hypothetical protein